MEIPQLSTSNQVLNSTIKFLTNFLNSLGKERDEVGKVKNVVNNPCRGTLDTFEKLKSNAIGDEFIDPGQYFLRKSGTKTSRP